MKKIILCLLLGPLCLPLCLLGLIPQSSYGQESEVVMKTATGDLYGTLSVPENTPNSPVVLLIAGSGPTDRDGNNPMMKNNALKMLAEMLRTNGIASLRFDKRGIAKSSNAGLQEKDLRFEDYVNDVNAWVSYLKKDKRFSQIIVAGHSEGSQIGILAAGGNPEIGKVISLAGAGRPASQILRKQLAKQPQQILDMCNPILEKLEKGDTVGQVSPLLYSLFRPSVQPYLISWFKYDPAQDIKRLKIPVLLISGANDLQCTTEEVELLANAYPKAQKHIIPGMTHVLKDCDSQDQVTQISAVYNNPDAPLDKSLEKIIVDFIKSK